MFNGALCILLCQLLFSWLGLFLVSPKGKKKVPLVFLTLRILLQAFVFPSDSDIFCNVIQQTLHLTWMCCYLFCWYKTHVKAFSLLQALGFLWYSDDQNFSFASTYNEPYLFKNFLQDCCTTSQQKKRIFWKKNYRVCIEVWKETLCAYRFCVCCD